VPSAWLAVAALALLGGVAGAQTRTEISLWHAQEGKSREAIEELVKRFNQRPGGGRGKGRPQGNLPEVIAAATAAYRQKEAPTSSRSMRSARRA